MDKEDLVPDKWANELDNSYRDKSWELFGRKICKHPWIKQVLLDRQKDKCPWCESKLYGKGVIHHLTYEHKCVFEEGEVYYNPCLSNKSRHEEIPLCHKCKNFDREDCLNRLVVVHKNCNKKINDEQIRRFEQEKFKQIKNVEDIIYQKYLVTSDKYFSDENSGINYQLRERYNYNLAMSRGDIDYLLNHGTIGRYDSDYEAIVFDNYFRNCYSNAATCFIENFYQNEYFITKLKELSQEGWLPYCIFASKVKSIFGGKGNYIKDWLTLYGRESKTRKPLTMVVFYINYMDT